MEKWNDGARPVGDEAEVAAQQARPGRSATGAGAGAGRCACPPRPAPSAARSRRPPRRRRGPGRSGRRCRRAGRCPAPATGRWAGRGGRAPADGSGRSAGSGTAPVRPGRLQPLPQPVADLPGPAAHLLVVGIGVLALQHVAQRAQLGRSAAPRPARRSRAAGRRPPPRGRGDGADDRVGVPGVPDQPVRGQEDVVEQAGQLLALQRDPARRARAGRAPRTGRRPAPRRPRRRAARRPRSTRRGCPPGRAQPPAPAARSAGQSASS